MPWRFDTAHGVADDRLGRCLARLDDCADQVAARLDRHFPEPGHDLAWSAGAIARPDRSGCVAYAASHWRVHLDRAVALHARLASIHAGRVRAEGARLARAAGHPALACWLGREVRDRRGADALALLTGSRDKAGQADETWAEAHAPALAERLWRLRAWLRALRLAASTLGEPPGVEEECSRSLGALLAPGAVWTSATAAAGGRTSVVAVAAPAGTADVRGVEWPAQAAGGTAMAGTCDPLGFAVAAGARSLAVIGLDTAEPVLAFDDRTGCQVHTAILGSAVGELADAAGHAARQARKRGSRFTFGTVAVTAWATTHDDVVEALHLRLDAMPRPALGLA